MANVNQKDLQLAVFCWQLNCVGIYGEPII